MFSEESYRKKSGKVVVILHAKGEAEGGRAGSWIVARERTGPGQDIRALCSLGFFSLVEGLQ